jgi:hypothetical protein
MGGHVEASYFFFAFELSENLLLRASGAKGVVSLRGLDIIAGLPGFDREGEDVTLMILALPCSLTRLTSPLNDLVDFRLFASVDALGKAMSVELLRVMPWAYPVASDDGVDGDEAMIWSGLLPRPECSLTE